MQNSRSDSGRPIGPDDSPATGATEQAIDAPAHGEHRESAEAEPAQDYSAGYKRFVLVMLTLVYAFNFIDRQILVILQEPIKNEMGLSDAQLGLLSGFTFAVIYVTAGIPIAYWADRSNRRNIVAAALTVWSGMTALSGLVQSYGQLLLARVGVGLGEAGGSPPAHSMISDYYPPEQRATALSFYSTGVYLGILLGFAFGGVLAEAVGWRTAFLLVGVPGVLLAAVLLATVREPLRGRWDSAAANASRPSFKQTLTLLKQRRSFWYVALASSLMAFIGYGNGNFLPSFLIRNHGMGIAEVGLVLSLAAGVSGMLGTFAGGYIVDRLIGRDKRWYVWVPMIGGILALFPYYFVLLGDNTPTVIGVLFAVSIVNSLYLGPSIAVAHAMVPPRMRALTSAVLFFILNMIGLGLGPFATGLASDLLAASSGADNLRHAMLITLSCAGPLAVLMYWKAAMTLRADLHAAARDA